MGSIEEVNRRFNEQVRKVEQGSSVGIISLGNPSEILLVSQIDNTELFIRESVLRQHMRKHGLTSTDLQNLPRAIQTPLMVYEWGEKAKSQVVVTGIEHGTQRITVAIKLERGGQHVEVNEVASVHGKDIERLLTDMNTTKTSFEKDNLKYIDKKRVVAWLNLTPPMGADVRTKQQLYATKIVQKFQNPPLKNQNVEESIEEVNRRFNEQLERQRNGILPPGYVYQLGRLGALLRSAGFPDLPIEMAAIRLLQKSNQENHPFRLSEVRNMVSHLNNPVAVFRYEIESKNVIVDIRHEDKHFLIGVHFNRDRRGIKISDIRGLFPKDDAKWLNWIQQGKADYLNKEKIQTLIDKRRTNFAEVTYLNLDSIAKIVKEFQNPILLEEQQTQKFRPVKKRKRGLGM